MIVMMTHRKRYPRDESPYNLVQENEVMLFSRYLPLAAWWVAGNGSLWTGRGQKGNRPEVSPSQSGEHPGNRPETPPGQSQGSLATPPGQGGQSPDQGNRGNQGSDQGNGQGQGNGGNQGQGKSKGKG